MEITKIDANTVRVTKTVEEVIDYETLKAQEAGIVEQQASKTAEYDAYMAESDAVLKKIREALATGIGPKAEE